MNFCPNCGRKREGENICDCGYNYETKEVGDPPYIESPLTQGIHNIGMDIVMHLEGVPLEELKRRRLDLGELLSVSYTSSGGMMGQFYSVELSFERNELTETNQEWHHGDRVVTYYKVSEEQAEEIKKEIIDNNFAAWAEVPVDRSKIAFDAPNSSMGLSFKEKYVNISTLIYMDQEENDLFIKVRKMVYALINPDNKISEKVYSKDDGQNILGSMTIQPPYVSKKFCPECGREMTNEQKECECGYKVTSES